jgi:hypothetical protein
MVKTLCIAILICCSTITAFAQHFELNAQCQQAYTEIFELRFDAAKLSLAKEKKDNPKNLMPIFLENYIDFLTLFISEQKDLFSKLESNKEARLEILKTGDKDSPYYLYTQAELHMQWAFSRVKFGEYIKAFLEIKKAYSLLNENQTKFPAFLPNLKSLGVLHTLIGAIPDKYKMGAKMFGMNASISQGMNELAQVIKDPKFQFKDEALIMYAMLQLHLNKNETEAWKIINTSVLQPKRSLTHCFAASSIAMYTGKNDKAIELLTNRPKGAEYYPFPFLDFYLAKAKLNRLDTDADIYFKKYLKDYKGTNYKKEAHLKLAWFYYLKGNNSSYNYHMQMAALDGEATTDEDKAALKEATSGVKPHKLLLKARLLFDGAYYDKSYEIINSIEIASLKTTGEQLEFYYRKARILDEMGQTTLAKKAYVVAIDKGKNSTFHFSPNACVKLGNIYEKEKDKTNATIYYKKALTFLNHDYKNSIDAEAKAGLNRLK